MLKAANPKEKARGALARLRRAAITPEKLLITVLSVSAAVREDPIGPGGPPHEYRTVQIAKAAQRLASGHHSVGNKIGTVREGNALRIVETGEKYRIDVYPRSSGQVLRHLGKALDDCCEAAVADHLSAILALKIERYGPADTDPYAHIQRLGDLYPRPGHRPTKRPTSEPVR